MEMENCLVTKKHKLGIFDILKEALLNFSKNINFLIFSLLASLPLFLLEKIYGAEAFALSAFFGRGNKRQGCLLMLVFFAWRLLLRLPCIATKCYDGGRGWFLVQLGLFCIANVIKWVGCLVYFYDCKRQKLEKKVYDAGREV
ncbi:hypothetical protein RCOM_0285850 [Ricinus communis]|uniref:Uncharacterized protein n=1 Tax=Ricinus communis TaxID=3988 RepID=B9T7V3_RICCO|nr:hypothetical protein RCOM_0285850 [Ricinus communis]